MYFPVNTCVYIMNKQCVISENIQIPLKEGICVVTPSLLWIFSMIYMEKTRPINPLSHRKFKPFHGGRYKYFVELPYLRVNLKFFQYPYTLRCQNSCKLLCRYKRCINLTQKYAQIFICKHCLFQEVNSFLRGSSRKTVSFEE